VYKLHLLTESEITFVLAGGGHNTGIVSEPGGRSRGYRVMTRQGDGKYVDPDAYLAQATQKDGSWWVEWRAWLERRSGEPVAPPPCGAPGGGYPALAEAPGTYVLEK
jgi:polyhydroxyalkanoate synthase